MTIKIEKGVPLIPKRFESHVYPFREMEIGDSFQLPAEEARRLRGAANVFSKRHKVKFSVRMVSGGVRVWRTA